MCWFRVAVRPQEVGAMVGDAADVVAADTPLGFCAEGVAALSGVCGGSEPCGLVSGSGVLAPLSSSVVTRLQWLALWWVEELGAWACATSVGGVA